MRTSLGASRTSPSGAVSSATVRLKPPRTASNAVGIVATDSMAASSLRGPTMRTTLGMICSPPSSDWPESGRTLTRAKTGTSLKATESSCTVTVPGLISATCTSVPLGISTLEGCSTVVHVEVLSVSGTCSTSTWWNSRARNSSAILPRSTTVSDSGAPSSVRPGGTRTWSCIGCSWVTCSCAATATYRMRARTTAANFSGQLRNRPRRTSVFIEQPPDQDLIHRAIPFRCPNDLLHDHAVTVDDEALGHPRRLILLLDHALAVVEHVEGKAELFDEGVHLGRIDDVDAHGEDVEVGAGHAVRQPLDRRHLDTARQAVGRPDVQQQHLAAVVVETRGLAGSQIDGVKVGGGGAHAHELDLRQNPD